MGLKLPTLSQKVLVCMLFHETLTGILPNLHVCIIGAYHRMAWVVGGHLFSLKTLLYFIVEFLPL